MMPHGLGRNDKELVQFSHFFSEQAASFKQASLITAVVWRVWSGTLSGQASLGDLVQLPKRRYKPIKAARPGRRLHESRKSITGYRAIGRLRRIDARMLVYIRYLRFEKLNLTGKKRMCRRDRPTMVSWRDGNACTSKTARRHFLQQQAEGDLAYPKARDPNHNGS